MSRFRYRASKVMTVAHRGACTEAPESTRAAIARALALKADMIELDVQLTVDRRLVVFHDDRLERTSNGRGHLRAWRYRDLARLDCGSWFGPRFAGQRMLLVSQALRLVPSPRHVNLELKRTGRPAVLIARLIRCLRWTRTVSRTLVSSFDASLLARLKTAQPGIARALLCRRHPLRALRRARQLGCVALHPHRSVVTASLIAKAHAEGLGICVWTVDDSQEARRLIWMGVDGLVTNIPARMQPMCARFGRDRTRSPHGRFR